MYALIDGVEPEEQTLLYVERVGGTGMALLLAGLCLLIILLLIIMTVYMYGKRHGRKKASAPQDTITTDEITQELSELPEQSRKMAQDTLADICFCESKEIIS